jgi:hypothetical protein
MPTDSGPEAIDRAREEVAAALAILVDSATSPSSAEVHLLQGWRLLHRSVAGAEAARGDAALVAWIRADALPLSNDAREKASALAAELAEDLAKPFIERASRRSRRQLLRNARALGRALDYYEPGQRGARAMRRLWLARGARVAAVAGLFAAFVVTIRAEPEVGSGPWRAALYPTRNFEGKPALQRHRDIDFAWGTHSPHERLPGNAFSVEWHTCLVLPEKTKLVFLLQSDDGSRLFVDGDLVVNAWSGGALRRAQGELELPAGVHHLQLDYFELSGIASINLRASLDGEKPAPIPASMLRYPGDELNPDDPCEAAER